MRTLSGIIATGAGVILLASTLRGQQPQPDTTARLPQVTVHGTPTGAPTGSLPEVRGTEIFAGKKTEVIRLDSINANTGLDITRQTLGRLPGANVTEAEGAGFPSNGVAFRGLNPVQSVEMNVRQDGVNIVADLYGYPETYYTPPADAVERIELVRGSSSLQFGPQFGGVIDYVLRDGSPDTPLAFDFKQTAGSYGSYTSYLSAAGGTDRWTYFGYAEYRGQQGWRPNSNLTQEDGAARVRFRASPRVTLGLEYSFLRNRIHMPGGLDNPEFNEDSRQSFRARNWLASPWNILAATLDARLTPTVRLTSSLSYMFSQRYLVWRNQDGGPAAADTVDPVTLAFSPREVEREYFDNVTSETRLRTDWTLFGAPQTLATGIRVFAGTLHRQEGGTGTTGSDFDMTLVEPYTTDVRFGTTNVAAFAENIVHLGSRLTVTPGARIEYLHSTSRGYTDTVFAPLAHDRTFVLGGAGLDYQTTAATDLYANVTQAYRPIEYSFLTPFASAARIDPHIRDPRGYNADIGWRGSLGSVASFDVGVFYLAYHDRIGLVSRTDSAGGTYLEETNVANSIHQGVESYVELHPLALVGAPAAWGSIIVWDALGYTHARYASGPYDGNQVEYAPDIVNRLGVGYSKGPLTTELQWAAISRQFTDANNTVASYDSDVGIVPAYQLFDWSARWRLDARTALAIGVNNIANIRYFTMRTTEYPGPGIIPGTGRVLYATLAITR